MKPYEVAAEALVLVGGLLRTTPLTEATTAVAARKLPDRWAVKVRRFLSADEWQEFDIPELGDYEEMRDQLMEDKDPDALGKLTAEILDHDLSQAYGQQLNKVRQYLAANWPMHQLDGGVGLPKLYTPSTMEQGGAWALYAVLGYPERIVDELLMGTLQDEQARAFQENYPELFGRLRTLLDFEFKEKQAAAPSYELPWPRERVWRTLLGLAEEVPITDAARGGKPEQKQQPAGPLPIDFSKERTRTADAAA